MFLKLPNSIHLPSERVSSAEQGWEPLGGSGIPQTVIRAKESQPRQRRRCVTRASLRSSACYAPLSSPCSG